MKPYILKYSGKCKMLLCLFLAIGCNLSVEGHFWPDDIFPYIFLVLNLFLAYRIDWSRLPKHFVNNQTKIYAVVLTVFCILLQSIILKIYIADSSVIFIKSAIKALLAGISTAVILMLAVFESHIYGERKKADIPFIIFCVLGMFYFYLIRRTEGGFSLYPVLLFALMYLVKENTGAVRNAHNPECIIIKIGAVCLAICETLGHLALTYWNYYGGLWKWLGLAAYGTAVWAFIFYYVLRALFVMIDDIEVTLSNEAISKATPKETSNAIKHTKLLLITFAILAIRCLYWMNWFPALLSKDTYTQMQQALGITPYSNHHPWLHTMLIKLFMGIGRMAFGSNQAGAAFTAFASLLVSSILILIILKFYCERTASGIWLFAAAIFILEPIHCIYSITIWKDVLFAYALLAFCFILMVMETQFRHQGKPKAYMWFAYVLLSFIFCFSRTNGLYAWIFTLPFLLWHYRKNLKPWIISTMVCVLLIIGYKGWLLPHFQVTEPDMVESLSVPLQQIAFTIQKGGKFSEYDTGVINCIADMESMGKRYDAHISDPVKNLIRDYGSQDYITQNKLDFIKMYISVGLKNPTDYIVAFLNQSRGYWYQKMSNYIYFSEGVHSNAAELGIYRNPHLPSNVSAALDKLMDKYCDIWHMFWSLALSTYVVLILFVYSLARKRSCFYFMPIIGVLITLVIATPVNDEFRYAYGIYLSLPLLLMESARNCNYHKERHG